MKRLEDIKFTPYESRPKRQKEKDADGPWATIHKGREVTIDGEKVQQNSVGVYGLPQFKEMSHFLLAWGEVEDGRINAVQLAFLTEERPKAMRIRKVKERSPYIDCPCPKGFSARWKRGSVVKWGAITETRIIDGRLIVRLPANIIVASAIKSGSGTPPVPDRGDPAFSTVRKLREREEHGQEERYVG